MNKDNLEKLNLTLESQLTEVRVLADSIKRGRNVLSDVAQDAEEKLTTQNHELFLYENNDKLQIIDELLFRLVKEMDEALTAADETRKQMKAL